MEVTKLQPGRDSTILSRDRVAEGSQAGRAYPEISPSSKESDLER